MARKIKRKKSVKKRTQKKKSVRRPAKKKKSTKKKKTRKVSLPAKGPKLPEEPIGSVTHYFPKVKATAIKIERDGIRVGDTLYFKGHTTRFKQKIESMQIEHQAVSQASPGDEVGIKVKSRTRENDLVFKL